jgi:Tfp pilus assembly protein PilN
MRAVNLLPRAEARRSVKATAPIITGVAASVLVTGILCAGFLMTSATVAKKRDALDAARAELALVPPPAPKPSGSASNLAGEETARVGALQAAINGRMAWDRVLREVSLVLPGDVWLTNMSLASPSGTPTAGFAIAGTTYSQDSVARLLSRLEVIPDLTNVQLQRSEVATTSKRGLVTFSIIANIRAPGATA